VRDLTSTEEFRRAEFVRRAEEQLGAQWRHRFAAGTGTSYSNVKRWGYGGAPVPDWAVAVIELVERLHGAGGRLPREWEP
jgi:hypothetical protein